ncbi:two-component system response regulator [Salinispira pacifica]|uniref:Diguanylate cyclase/phosphodiesterase (GGDEF & EAL domains) with PAS/PAC sensor(S) n=1 Tax=Salinispira pacifica TaxID=1307761 RepID=V5WJY6_9SPIO|nr:EAL domain-containing protein [Salinispira pacifica]AHC15486.1 diguanylate cyclase/phosphodiesterase (GGDEF & EAL domains) with PAS/PAC sensor(s) [Salinispira pacifica]
MENLSLIIIEDDAIIGMDLKRRLNKMGILSVQIFANAQKALQQLRNESCDLVLMDIGLPGEMDGVDAAAIIRQQYHIPVVFVTGFADEKTLNRARLAEPAGFILKPFKEHEIYATITISIYRNRMEGRLRSQQEMQGEILNHIQDGIITVGSDYLIRYTNPKSEKMLAVDSYGSEKELGHYSDELKSFCQELTGKEEGYTRTWDNYLLNLRQGIRIVDISITKIHLPPEAQREEDRGFLVVLHDKTQLKTMEAQVAYHESHDRLTGLLNRSEFQAILEQELENGLEDSRHRSLVFFDIDQFTLLNEISGHLAGDELLKQISKRLEVYFETSPAISRLGDDEFAVILQGDSPGNMEKQVKGFLKELNREKFNFQDSQFPLSITAGMCHFSRELLNSHLLLSIAIDANILAKGEQGTTFKVLTLEDEVLMKRRGELRWISTITDSLEQNRFLLYFQPIIPLQKNTGLVNKVEILIRMLDENNELVPPGDFIPAAERYNLMHLVDRWVIHRLLSNFAQAEKAVGVECPIFCINLSGASMLSSDLDIFISSEIERYDIDPKRICFEITETSAISNMSNATTLISSLRSYGCLFALDDFGNGFSNFNYLRYLEVDYLKIDGSFVRNMDTNPISRAMVEAINSLSQAVNKKTIAEFVSNPQILRILTDIGVHYGQGYAIGKPRALLEN